MSPAMKVAVAVVESGGRVLVGTRPEGVPLAGKSEFPGGKCLADETPRSCVVRECGEETGLMVIPRSHLVTTTYQYDHGLVELHFWKCSLASDLPECAPAAGTFEWICHSELPRCDFPEANAEVLAILTERESQA